MILKILHYNKMYICAEYKFILYQVLQFYRDPLHHQNHFHWYHRSLRHHTFSLPTKIHIVNQQIPLEKIKIRN